MKISIAQLIAITIAATLSGTVNYVIAGGGGGGGEQKTVEKTERVEVQTQTQTSTVTASASTVVSTVTASAAATETPKPPPPAQGQLGGPCLKGPHGKMCCNDESKHECKDNVCVEKGA